MFNRRYYEDGLFLPIFLLGAWVSLHPYRGLHHDARLYALEAVSGLAPERYSGDLHLEFNPQGELTIFSPFFAGLTGLLGLEAASMVLFVVGHCLWLIALCFLIWRVLGAKLVPLGLLCVAALPADYGGYNALSFGEGFLTPRIFAEAAVLLGAGLLFSSAPMKALGAFLVAAALHPLIGAGALGLFTIHLMIERLRWGLSFLIIGAGLILFGALAGVPSLAALTEPIGETHLNLLQDRTPYLFPSLWRAPDFVRMALVFALLGSAAKASSGNERRFFLTTGLATLAALLLAVLGGDLLDNLLVIQLQPWRLLWLGQVAGLLGLAKLIVWSLSDGRSDGGGRLLVLLTVFALALSGVAPLALLVALWGLGCLWVQRWADRFKLLAAALPILTALLLLGATIQGLIAEMTSRELGDGSVLWSLLPAALIAAFLWMQASCGRTRLLAVCVSVSLALLSLLSWNQQFPAAAYLIQRPDLIAMNKLTLPIGESVYWPGNPMAVLFGLQRGSFYSYEQGAGIAFSERLAREFERRQRIVAPLGGSFAGSFAEFGGSSPVTVSRGNLLAACEAKRSFGAIVLPVPLEGLEGQVFTAPLSYSGNDLVEDGHFYLYRCAELTGMQKTSRSESVTWTRDMIARH